MKISNQILICLAVSISFGLYGNDQKKAPTPDAVTKIQAVGRGHKARKEQQKIADEKRNKWGSTAVGTSAQSSNPVVGSGALVGTSAQSSNPVVGSGALVGTSAQSSNTGVGSGALAVVREAYSPSLLGLYELDSDYEIVDGRLEIIDGRLILIGGRLVPLTPPY